MTWKKTRISEFLTERTDRFKPDQANELGLPRIEKIDFSGTIYINNFKPTKTAMILVKDGDLVISGINVEKGALAIYEGETDALATIHYSSYTYDENNVDVEYLKWYLQSNIFRNILKEQVKGGIKTEIKPKTFLNLEILLPDITTQKQIASKLNKLEWNVKDLDFTCFCNKELIKSLKQSIIENSLYHSNIKYSDAILQDVIIGKPKNGFSPKPVNYKTSTKILTLSATTSGKFNPNHYKYVDTKVDNGSELWLYPDDILIQRGNSIDYVGIAAIYTGNEKEFIYPDLMIKIRANNEVILPEYLYYILISPRIRKYFKDNATGTSGSMPKINHNILLNTPIKYPELALQKGIIEQIKLLQNYSEMLETENSNAQKSSSELLQSIMQKYFTREV